MELTPVTPSAGSAAVSWSSKDHGMKEGTGAGISVTSVQMGKKYQVKREGKELMGKRRREGQDCQC